MSRMASKDSQGINYIMIRRPVLVTDKTPRACTWQNQQSDWAQRWVRTVWASAQFELESLGGGGGGGGGVTIYLWQSTDMRAE